MRVPQYFYPAACVLGWLMAAPLPAAAEIQGEQKALKNPAAPNTVEIKAPAEQQTDEKIAAIAKPKQGAAVMVKIGLEKNYLIDLSALAGEKVTLVRLSDRLLILFDNKSAVTIAPFADAQNKPPANVKFKTGGRILTGAEFLPAFALTSGKASAEDASTLAPAQIN
jgi:hypothetical protein